MTFGYTAASEIRSRQGSNDAFAWKSHHNLSLSETPDGLNRLDRIGAVQTSHDARGNMVSDGTHAYAYSSENLLLTASGGVSLSYDPLLRLRSVSSPAGSTAFGYDGLDLALEKDPSTGAVVRRHVHGLADDEPLVSYDGAGTGARRWLHADERGSIVAGTDGAGTVLWINRFDEYGVPATGNSGRFQYTGQAWLPELGLHYYKARMYDAAQGRFLQPDPIGYDDGMNMYAYVGGDPVNQWDPSGLGPNCRSGRGDTDCDWDTGVTVTVRRRDTQLDWAWLLTNDVYRDVGDPGYRLGLMVHVYAQEAARASSASNAAKASLDRINAAALARAQGGRRRGIGAQRLKPGCGCFEAGTLIATPDGLVPIEAVGIGDLVLAQNESTAEVAAKPVTDLIRPEPKPLYRLTLRDVSGEVETFHATDDHPWKVEGRGWVETANLTPDDRIDTASGADMVLLSIEKTDRVERTYNLTVADWHTFLVGEDQAVVHNACPKVPKDWRPPTNPPQLPPATVPSGWRIRYGSANEMYPTGYWRLEKPLDNGGWQGINPRTMKPGPQWDTHVAMPWPDGR